MTEEERAWNYVLRLISIRPRSQAELRQRLLRKGFAEDLAGQILAKAEEAGFADDRVFARLYAEDRLLFRPCPRRRVVAELRAMGVDEKLAAEATQRAFADASEEELARRALEGKRARWEKLPQPLALRRAYSFLLRRGFTLDLARKVAEESFGPWTSESG